MTTRTRINAFLAIVLCTLAMAGFPVVADRLPQAEAVTPATPPSNQSWSSSAWKYKDCSFRKSAGDATAEAFSDELCWIDQKEALGLGSTPKQVTKDLGRYTLTYMLSQVGEQPASQTGRIAVGTTASTALAPGVTTGFAYVDDSSLFGNTINGVSYFVPESGDSNRPVIKTNHDATWSRKFRFVYDQIKLIDKATGQQVPNPRFMVADAQQTARGTGSEVLTVHEPSEEVFAGPVARFTPALKNYSPACSVETNQENTFGPVPDPKWYARHNIGPADFGCLEWSGLVLSSNSQKAGMYLVSVPNATRIEVSTYSWSTQAFALALDFGRMRGNVAADTQQEKLATGQETSFDFTMGVRAGNATIPAPWQGPDTYTQVTRSLNMDAKNGLSSLDPQVFASTASGSQADQVFNRYDTVWTCTIPGRTDTIKTGSVPAGYKLTNDPATKKSELIADNPDNKPITCTVNWTPKFIPATLTLGKIREGSASSYNEFVDKTFEISYSCVPPHHGSKTDQQASDEFTKAYPTVKLTDTKKLKSGDTVDIAGLPSGAICNITEAESAKPAPDSGVDHALSWAGGSELAPSAGATLPARTVTLVPLGTGATSNSVRATNKYTAHTGTVNLSKTVLGDPVGSVIIGPRTYNFDINCPDANFRKTVELTLNGTNSLSGTTTLNGVPTGRNCTITPLTGLSDKERQTVKFDKRVLNVGANADVQPNSFDAYPFTIPDYPSGGAPTSINIDITTTYSWKTVPLTVSKHVTGPAAEKATGEYPAFSVNYECAVPGDASSNKSGVVELPADGTAVTIPEIRVGAECRVWEPPLAAGQQVDLSKTRVAGSKLDGTETVLDNAEAQSTAVITAVDSADPNQNKVVVTNAFRNKLGTVDVTKIVNAAGLTTELPASYDLGFDCGARSVEVAGNVRSVALRGTVNVSPNGTRTLSFKDSDAELAKAVNDAAGNMQVPYGNTCTFSETRPELTTTGILWSTDVNSVKVTVSGPTQTATVTNTYTASGDGLTITRVVAANPQMAGTLSYQLSCTNNGQPLVLPGDGAFQLADGENKQFSATDIPAGSECSLKADTYMPADKTRTVDGVTFPIRWTWEATFPENALGTEATLSGDSDSTSLSVPSIVVGDKSVVTITSSYDYVWTTYSAEKQVAFPGPSLISEERQRVAKDREFVVHFPCVAPYGETGNRAATLVDGKVTFTSRGIPVGSKCTAYEETAFTPAGVDLTQEVSFNGSPYVSALDQKATYIIKDSAANNKFTFRNSYKRRTTSVELNKIANTPIDLKAYENQFHTHAFTMTCVDPLVESRPALTTFNGSIQGEGQWVVEGVPVGAECQITGDNFGRLDLKETSDGRDLQTHLRPNSVDWDLTRNDATSLHDDKLPNDTTTSMFFATEDGSNVVNLTNNYEIIPAKLDFSKKITAANQAELDEVTKGGAVEFSYRCEGVGYTKGVIGPKLGSNLDVMLPNKITVDQFTETVSNPDGTVSKVYRPNFDLVVSSGALCTFTEVGASTDAVGFTKAVSINGEQGTSLEQRIVENSDQLQAFNFDNNYSRKMVPVRLVALKEGFLDGVSPEGYHLNVKCDDGRQTTAEVVQTLNQAQTTVSVTDATPPVAGQIVNLPAGSSCSLTVSGASLAALPTLEVTQGTRTPFIQFGDWVGHKKSDTNPTVSNPNIAPADVTAAMKQYEHKFVVPSDAVTTADGEVMTVAADVYYPQDTVDVTFTKEMAGSPEGTPSFEFSTNCIAGNSFTLSAGNSVKLPNVPVTKTCSFTEINDSLDNAQPILEVTSHGDRLGNIQVSNAFTEQDTAELHSVSAAVLPVTSATDTSSGGAPWSLVATNKYPALKITKRIAGAPISSVTGAVADMALIPHTQDSMEFTYTVENKGAIDLTKLSFVEPGLAGRTVIQPDGTEVTIDAEGNIPSEVCTLSGTDLNSGATATCTFTVKITEPHDQNFTYKPSDGKVTVTGTASAGVITASDSFGAFRPMDSLAWALPETGVQTLVWVLILGLLILGYGVYRWRRDREEEDS
ncbi:hypothetical protein HW450_09780 [Corynebacterium hindlerae]|uniref:DUF5979 domain-containing protein n=1 Tax=Corynebacterium hindlerae TaxID=699041 RepID=A0A7G5FDE8_9CORY|nr:DUF5979 domain-containing protein [Corynebacterium hindlerae]QMV84639.1 hypothetical protein HW450_09780 [Corynebacterium hindlerae]